MKRSWNISLQLPLWMSFFPKQFTVGVLNATLDLAALVLVGVVGFLGSEVVLSPVVSSCLPSYGGWVLVGVATFLGSEMVVSLHVGGGSWLLWPHLGQNIQKSKSQFQSKFAHYKLFGVYAGLIFSLSRLNKKIVFVLPQEQQDWAARFLRDKMERINNQTARSPAMKLRRIWFLMVGSQKCMKHWC